MRLSVLPQLISQDGQQPSSIQRYACAWSATCNPNWCRISSTVSPAEPRPMFTHALSMADRIITRLKRCSRLLPEHCAPPAGTINKWLACSPAPKDCCDRNRRLPGGQSHVSEEGV